MSERRTHHHPNKVLNEPFFSFKILFLGGIGVGKTCIINRYVKNIFINDQTPTIGIDYKSKIVIYNSKKIKLKIFDTSGQERFHTLTKNYYRGADGIIMVFDLKRSETFDELTYWMEEINKNCDKNKIGLILVGNKNDGNLDERKISREQGNKIAELYNFIYIETSAVTNDNIKECFDLMVKTLFEKNVNDCNNIKNNNEEKGDIDIDKNKVVNDKKETIVLNINNHRVNNTPNNNHNNDNDDSCCDG
jgi:small GTP-binding protein